MRTTDFVLFILLLSPSLVSAQSACPGDPSGCLSLQTADLKSVFEVVNGISDGANRVYRLSNVPSTKFAVRLFRNETELNPSSDYTVQGKNINLTGQALQVAGDVLHAAYAVDVASEREDKLTQYPVPLESNPAILSRYLQRSLDQDLSAQASRLAVGLPIESASSHQISAPSRSATDPRSLRMLTTALNYQASAEAPASRGVRRHNAGPAVGQGVEGLGDHLLSGPFDLLAAAPGSLNENIDSIGSHSSSGRGVTVAKHKPSRAMRSLSMLQSRISDSPPQ
jgi:hypothetical protein